MGSNEISSDIVIWRSGSRVTPMKRRKNANDTITITTSNMMPSFPPPDVSPNDARFAITCFVKPYRSWTENRNPGDVRFIESRVCSATDW